MATPSTPAEQNSILDPIVNTEQGRVRGAISKDARGGQFYSFLGIRYAKAPIGDLRFKVDDFCLIYSAITSEHLQAPVPPDPWQEVFDATEGGNICIQEHYLTGELDGSEDCLNLNVFTPCVSNLSIG